MKSQNSRFVLCKRSLEPALCYTTESIKLWNGKEVKEEDTIPFTDELLLQLLKKFKKTSSLAYLCETCKKRRDSLREFLFMNWGKISYE